MTTTTYLDNAPDLCPEDYCVFGVATCFFREDGDILQTETIEPIPSAALEAILQGIPTSYHLACAKSLGEIIVGNTVQIPAEFPTEAKFCDNFHERVIAATRTYKNKPSAQNLIPLNTVYRDFNYSLDRKRVLNAVNKVSTEDNVKQHSHTHKVL